MTSHSQAAVTVYFEQVDADVVATWTGLIDAGNWMDDYVAPLGIAAEANRFYGVSGAIDRFKGGTANPTDLDGVADSITGSAGFIGGLFMVEGISGDGAPGSPIYNFDTLGVTQTFADDTLANIGAASFNNTLAWTSSEGGTNTISYTTVAVPEPSTTALIISLGALALAVRRRRQLLRNIK